VPLLIEHYALIGDCHTAALVGRDGSIDWLCVPQFDSGAVFAALLGSPENGRWRIAPRDTEVQVARRYRAGTLVLETDFETSAGAVRIIDFMPLSKDRLELVRIVEGLRGSVAMELELVIRFDYGAIVPWVRHSGGDLTATAGPDTLQFSGPVEIHGENLKSLTSFNVAAGERLCFVLDYRRSHEPALPMLDAERALRETESSWRAWCEQGEFLGQYRAAVQRSLLTLKALTFQQTGGIVAAPTTSLPEKLGGVRNWDYRFCWLRDATFTLNALLLAGYRDEALAWREWLLRAIAGSPQDLQIVYGAAGERRLEELELPWLPGYRGAAPVRIGNAAHRQFQLDVYGEVMDTLHLARQAGLEPDANAWHIQVELLRYLEQHWRDPDEGIWEIRGPRRHFTHSKMMAWVAFDRAIKDAGERDRTGPVEHWRAIRAAIHADVCRHGFDAERNTFVQSYGAQQLDASLLLMAEVGFLPPSDPRVRGTIEALVRDLTVDGLVLRYSTDSDVDRLPPGEGAFLPCTFWLVDSYVLTGRRPQAIELFERLLGLMNDVGLLSEEYDPHAKRMLGNFPQALSHMALINSARLLSLPAEVAQRACDRGERPAHSRTS